MMAAALLALATTRVHRCTRASRHRRIASTTYSSATVDPPREVTTSSMVV